MQRSPILFIVSGPSGSGKGTILSYLKDDVPGMGKVVNYTTRRPRPGEEDGIDYNYVSEEEFFRLVERGHIFEYERVYNDYYYGSPANALNDEMDRVIELDYKGHRTYREYIDGDVVSIFLLPPSLQEMQRRIQQRAEEKNLQSRLENAHEQVRRASEYDYVLLNDDLHKCRRQVRAIVTAERARRRGARLLHQFLSDEKCFRCDPQ